MKIVALNSISFQCHPAAGRGPATRRLPRMSHMPPAGGGQTPPFGGVVVTEGP